MAEQKTSCDACGHPLGDVFKHDCEAYRLGIPVLGGVRFPRGYFSAEAHTDRAMDDVASGKIKTPEEFMDKIKEPRSPEPGRAYALFLAGASLAELSRAFMVSEAEIEAALRGHIARRERERKC